MSEVIDTDEGLFALYVAECDRTKSKPSISDFIIWKSDKGYEDDLSDQFNL